MGFELKLMAVGLGAFFTLLSLVWLDLEDEANRAAIIKKSRAEARKGTGGRVSTPRREKQYV